MTDSADIRPSTGGQDGNLVLALIVHFGVGFLWLFALGAIFTAAGSLTAGVIWALCTVPLWIADSVRMIRARRHPGRVWRLTFTWWLRSFIAPLFLLVEAVSLRAVPRPEPASAESLLALAAPASNPPPGPDPPNPESHEPRFL